jgi:hypothetical protein
MPSCGHRVAQAFQSVPAQSKACAYYILPFEWDLVSATTPFDISSVH